MTSSAPLYWEIAQAIERQIIQGTLPEGAQVPSTNELSAFYRVNPATAAKGVAILVEQGALYKQRGVGMFVAKGARETLIAKRRESFAKDYLAPLLAEAEALGLTNQDLVDLITSKKVSA